MGEWINVKDGSKGCFSTVTNLDTGDTYTFTAKTAIEALQKMIYTLNISGKCDAIINKTESGNTLYFEHKGNTYAAVS